MVEPLKHRRTKGAETDMLDLTPPRRTPTLPVPVVPLAEGFRTPALCRRAGLDAGPAFESLAGRKPRGERGAVLIGRDLWDLKVADGSHVWLRGPEAPSLIAGSEDDELVRSRGYEGLV